MIVRRLKFLAAALSATAVGIGVVATTGGLAGGIAFFRSGADPAAALHETAFDMPGTAEVGWQPDGRDLPRAMEEATRTAITAAYLAAWDYRTQGAETDYLAGPASAAMAEAPDPAVREVDLAHDLALAFYSADGQLVAFDARATVTRRAALAAGRWSESGAERYTVVMILVDGNWRLRHWVRHSS